MKKLKKMCKYDAGDFSKLKEQLSEEICRPQFFCKKCLRVSRDESLLCKPVKISKLEKQAADN